MERRKDLCRAKRKEARRDAGGLNGEQGVAAGRKANFIGGKVYLAEESAATGRKVLLSEEK